jgi:hypothetical protein
MASSFFASLRSRTRSIVPLVVLLLCMKIALDYYTKRSKPVKHVSKHPARNSPHSVISANSASAAAAISIPLSPAYIKPVSWRGRDHFRGYATWLFTDLFLKGDTIFMIGSQYYRFPNIPHDNFRLSAPALGLPAKPFTKWKVRDDYESVVVGEFVDTSFTEVGREGLDIVLTWEDREGMIQRDFHLEQLEPARRQKNKLADSTEQLRSKSKNSNTLKSLVPFRREHVSRFGMCALFHTDAHLLEMWVSYWWLLGVDYFYLHYNGIEEDIPGLQKRLEKYKASFSLIHWPFDYWVSDLERPHHGQPMAINDCYYRNRDRHEIIFMYDLDELLVYPHHTSLDSFFDYLKKNNLSFSNLISQSSWTRVDLQSVGAEFNTLTVDHFAKAPLTRSNIHYERGKYAVNTSRHETGLTILNVHGVYNIECAPRPTSPELASVNGFRQFLMNETVAYHFHLTNVGRDRKRDGKVINPQEDSRASVMIREGILRRGRPEREEIALTQSKL